MKIKKIGLHESFRPRMDEHVWITFDLIRLVPSHLARMVFFNDDNFTRTHGTARTFDIV